MDAAKALFGDVTMPNGNIDNNPISFVWEPDIKHNIEGGKWIPVLTKDPYEIDIRLDDGLRVKTGNLKKDKNVTKMFNSGR